MDESANKLFLKFHGDRKVEHQNAFKRNTSSGSSISSSMSDGSVDEGASHPRLSLKRIATRGLGRETILMNVRKGNTKVRIQKIIEVFMVSFISEIIFPKLESELISLRAFMELQVRLP